MSINEYLINTEGEMILLNENVKYPSLFIDSRLKVEYHNSITSCRVRRIINTVWNCPEIDIKTKKLLYHSLVESYLIYGILRGPPTWGWSKSSFMLFLIEGDPI